MWIYHAAAISLLSHVYPIFISPFLDDPFGLLYLISRILHTSIPIKEYARVVRRIISVKVVTKIVLAAISFLPVDHRDSVLHVSSGPGILILIRFSIRLDNLLAFRPQPFRIRRCGMKTLEPPLS